MRIKYDPQIAKLFRDFSGTLCNIRERNSKNIEQARKDHEEQLHSAIVALTKDDPNISSKDETFWDHVLSRKKDLQSVRDLNITLAQDRMDQISESLAAQQNAMFIYAFGVFEKFIADMVKVAVKKNKTAKERYQDKFIDFANNQFAKQNTDIYQREIGNLTKMLNSFDTMIGIQGGPFNLLLYMFDKDKQMIGDSNFKHKVDMYKEIRVRRNLLIHRGSVADRQYYAQIKKAKIKKWEKLLSEHIFLPMQFKKSGSKYFIDFSWDADFWRDAGPLEGITSKEWENDGKLIPADVIKSEPSFNLNVNPDYLDRSLSTLILLAGKIFIHTFRVSDLTSQEPFIGSAISNISQNYSLPNTGNNLGINGYMDVLSKEKIEWEGETTVDIEGVYELIEESLGRPSDYVETDQEILGHIDFEQFTEVDSDKVDTGEVEDNLEKYSYYEWYDFLIMELARMETQLQRRERSILSGALLHPTCWLLWLSVNFLIISSAYKCWAFYILGIRSRVDPILSPTTMVGYCRVLEQIEIGSAEADPARIPFLYRILQIQLTGDDKIIDEFIQSVSNEDFAVNLDLISPDEDQDWPGINLNTLYQSPIFRFYRDNEKIQKFFESPYDYWVESSIKSTDNTKSNQSNTNKPNLSKPKTEQTEENIIQ